MTCAVEARAKALATLKSSRGPGKDQRPGGLLRTSSAAARAKALATPKTSRGPGKDQRPGGLPRTDISHASVNTPTEQLGGDAGRAADLRFIESVGRTVAQHANRDR